MPPLTDMPPLTEIIKTTLQASTGTEWTHIGDGQEAYVFSSQPGAVQGPINRISNNRMITVARRVVAWDAAGGWPTSTQHQYMFFKNLFMYLLDRSAVQHGTYSESHIPLPLGMFMLPGIKGHSYQYVEGTEGWPTVYYDEGYHKTQTQFREWDDFAGLFNKFGFSVGHDIADASGGDVGKNIIYRPEEGLEEGDLGKHWKRIDLGSTSLPLDKHKLTAEGSGLSGLIGLCADYLIEGGKPSHQLLGQAQDYVARNLNGN